MNHCAHVSQYYAHIAPNYTGMMYYHYISLCRWFWSLAGGE